MQVLNQETIVGNGCWKPTASSYSDQLVNLTSNTLRATCCNQSISLCWFVQLVCKTSLCNWGLDWFATGCTLVIFLHKIKAVFVNHVSNLQIQLLWRWQLTASRPYLVLSLTWPFKRLLSRLLCSLHTTAIIWTCPSVHPRFSLMWLQHHVKMQQKRPHKVMIWHRALLRVTVLFYASGNYKEIWVHKESWHIKKMI